MREPDAASPLSQLANPKAAFKQRMQQAGLEDATIEAEWVRILAREKRKQAEQQERLKSLEEVRAMLAQRGRYGPRS